MGSRGPLPKPQAERQGHRALIALPEPDPSTVVEIPAAPTGITGPDLATWERLWSSKVAAHWDRESDLHVVERLIRSLAEVRKLERAISRGGRLTSGSMQQARINPLYTALAREDKIVQGCEDRLGITPQGRLRLGLLGVKGALTAAQLNAMVERPDLAPALPDEFADEFEVAL